MCLMRRDWRRGRSPSSPRIKVRVRVRVRVRVVNPSSPPALFERLRMARKAAIQLGSRLGLGLEPGLEFRVRVRYMYLTIVGSLRYRLGSISRSDPRGSSD